jgi:serine protease Do
MPSLPARALILALSASSLAGCVRSPDASARPNGTPTATAKPSPAAAPVAVLPSPALARAGNANIADVVQRVLPSVVSVWSSRVSRMPMGFFPGGSRDLHQEGLGSGVVIAPGIVITNNHVVEDATELKVTTSDKHELEAKVIGTDPKSDLAVLQVSGDTAKLVPIALGDSSRLRLGDVVLAVGNPFGVGQTVTMGIVSAKGRANMGIVDYEDFIQTDAAINPGNSGGALVDMEGHLVGINTAILSRTGGSVGIGFAIPTNMAQPIIESLRTNGKVVRGWLGVSIQGVDQDLATAMKLPNVAGVLVSDVRAGTPADRAGLHRGDVIVSLEGHDVDGVGQFRNAIAAKPAGAKVTLGVVRDGKHLDLGAALEAMPSDASLAHASAPSGLDGLTLGDLSAENRRAHQVPASVKQGVLVTDVERGSPAARAGLRANDVVIEVNRKPVKGVRQFSELYSASGPRVLLLVWRDGNTLFIVARR